MKRKKKKCKEESVKISGIDIMEVTESIPATLMSSNVVKE